MISYPKRKFSAGTLFDVLNITMMVFFVFITLYPFWYILILSLTNVRLVPASEIYFLPVKPTLDSYVIVLRDKMLMNGYLISLLRVITGVSIGLVCNCMAAYAISRPEFMLRKPLNTAVLITMFVSGGMIPFYLVVNSLKLTNTFWALVLPFAFDPFGIMIIKSFYKNIPMSLSESAKIDGASDFTIFVKLYLPLSMPILATMSLFWAVFYWNDFIWGSFLVMKESLYPVQAILYKIIVQSSNTILMQQARMKNPMIGANMESLKAAAIIMTTVPILMVYPFLQRYFVKGVTLGAIKE